MARPPGRRRRSLLLSVPSRADRGEVSLSHLAVVLLVATISGALVASHLPTLISTEIETAVCTVTSSDCPTDRQHGPPGGPAASGDSTSQGDSSAAGLSGAVDPLDEPGPAPAASPPPGKDTADEPDNGGYWDCGWFGKHACDTAYGFGSGFKTLWAEKAATACLFHLCTDAAFNEQWSGFKQLINDPVDSIKTSVDESIEPFREDWNSDHKGSAIARAIPSTLNAAFGGLLLGKLGKLAKNKNGPKKAKPEKAETPPDEPHPDLPRIYNVRTPTEDDIAAIFAAYRDNAARIGEWNRVYRSPEEVEAWLRSLGPSRRAYLIEDGGGPEGGLAGIGFINSITRDGPSSSAFLAYDAFAPYVGKGWMTEGLKRVISKAFTPESEGGLGLDQLEIRVEARNQRSIALARRLGGQDQGTIEMFANGANRELQRYIVKRLTKD